jgi:HSP20 family protein
MEVVMRHYDLMRPFSLLEGFDKDFDKLFYPKVGKSEWKPLSRVKEEEGHYHLALDIPGVDKEFLKVELKDLIISISGERKDSFVKKNSNEESVMRFEQHFSLPKDSNIAEIEVSQKNGILDIVIPKQNKQVEVKSFEIKDGENSLFI